MSTLLPAIVQGRRVHPGETDNQLVLNFDKGFELTFPDLEGLDDDALMPQPEPVAKLTIDEITSFLSRVGRHLLDKSDALWDAARLSARLTGLAETTIARDLDSIADLMAGQERLYAILETELGSFHAMDEWLPVEAVYRKALPRGLAYHVMVGNVPAAAMYTLLRGMIAKNASVAKLPSRDPTCALWLAQGMLDVDPEHPLSRSMTIGYWSHRSPLHDRFIAAADSASVWGGDEACRYVQERVPLGCPVLVHGAKRSVSLVDLGHSTNDDAARRLAADVATYDQEACFSTQVAVVVGADDGFVDDIARWMRYTATARPRGTLDFDDGARRLQMLRQAELMGLGVRAEESDEPAWALVVCDDSDAAQQLAGEHALARTLVVLRTSEWRDVLTFVDRHTQTVGLHPFEHLQAEVRDAIAAGGADRMCDVGRADRPRAGFTHDGYWPQQSLVRWVSIDRATTFRYKHWFAPEHDMVDLLFGAEDAAAEPAASR